MDVERQKVMDAKRVHLLGIGGAGMSGLALLLKDLGYEVSGCDVARTCYTDKVEARSIEVALGHGSDHLDRYNPDLLIYSSAVAATNPEIVEALNRGILTARRAEVLSILFNSRIGVGVAGTHGKTTTSSMISLIMERSGQNPTVAIGGELCDIGCNAKLGEGAVMVAELDESDGSFELFAPHVAVVTNIDWDHVDHYPDLDSVIDGFSRFLSKRHVEGVTVLCAEDVGVRKLLARENLSGLITYGLGPSWDWGAQRIEHLAGGGVVFELLRRGIATGKVQLSVSGEHNVLNALASLAAADFLGVNLTEAIRSLGAFRGAKRRLQFVGRTEGVDVYDDYAHHPREIVATLTALRQIFPRRRLLVAFQPHRYTRTAALCRDFASALSLCDVLALAPIYPADESPLPGVDSNLIGEAMRQQGFSELLMAPTLDDLGERLLLEIRPGDLVVTVGAGNINKLGKRLLNAIKGKGQNVVAVGA